MRSRGMAGLNDRRPVIVVGSSVRRPLLFLLNRRFDMFLSAKRTPLATKCLLRHVMNLWKSAAIILSAVLFACSGCGDSKAPVPPAPPTGPVPLAATPPAEAKTDPLADVLGLAKTGDIDAAIRQFVSNAPDNWFESTSLVPLRMSEADFAAADRAEKVRLQQQLIDRVGEIKGFARTVMDRANEAKKRGDQETAHRYLDAVNRFGRQLRDSDAVITFQQTGNALANMTLSE